MTTAIAPSTDTIAGLSLLARAGWRVDGPPAMAALGARWHHESSTVWIDGPAGRGITSLDQLSALLRTTDQRRLLPHRPTGPVRMFVTSDEEGTAVLVVCRWHRGGVESVPVDDLLVPPVHEQFARRLHTITVAPPLSSVWLSAATDTAALLDLAGRTDRPCPSHGVPAWLLERSRTTLAGWLDADWPGHRPDDVRDLLVQFATTRP